MRTSLLVLMVAGLLAGMAGCGAQPIDRRLVVALSRTPYPKDAPLGPDLDIVVVPSRTQIELVNRTPRTYRAVQLWLNQQYVTQSRRIDIGRSPANRLPLARFIDHHGDAFPVGGLLTPDKGFPVVLAELFDPETGQRHRLLVKKGG